MEKLKLLTPSSAEAHYRVEDGRFGLWDVRDKCWLGDKDGPNVYTNKLMARMAGSSEIYFVFGDKVGETDNRHNKNERAHDVLHTEFTHRRGMYCDKTFGPSRKGGRSSSASEAGKVPATMGSLSFS